MKTKNKNSNSKIKVLIKILKNRNIICNKLKWFKLKNWIFSQIFRTFTIP